MGKERFVSAIVSFLQHAYLILSACPVPDKQQTNLIQQIKMGIESALVRDNASRHQGREKAIGQS